MRISERDRSILEHIISYCRDIEDTVLRFGDSYELFAADKAYRNACAMCILQIGELGGHLSQEFRSSYRQMPWSEIKSMRNVMAHAYGSLNIETTWETIESDIPALKEFCFTVLDEHGKTDPLGALPHSPA